MNGTSQRHSITGVLAGRSAAHELDGVGQEGPQVDLAAAAAARVGEGEHPAHHPGDPAEAFAQDRHPALRRFEVAVAEVELENLEMVAHPGQRIVDLVGQPGGQPADARQPLGVQQLALELAVPRLERLGRLELAHPPRLAHCQEGEQHREGDDRQVEEKRRRGIAAPAPRPRRTRGRPGALRSSWSAGTPGKALPAAAPRPAAAPHRRCPAAARPGRRLRQAAAAGRRRRSPARGPAGRARPPAGRRPANPPRRPRSRPAAAPRAATPAERRRAGRPPAAQRRRRRSRARRNRRRTGPGGRQHQSAFGIEGGPAPRRRVTRPAESARKRASEGCTARKTRSPYCWRASASNERASSSPAAADPPPPPAARSGPAATMPAIAAVSIGTQPNQQRAAPTRKPAGDTFRDGGAGVPAPDQARILKRQVVASMVSPVSPGSPALGQLAENRVLVAFPAARL